MRDVVTYTENFTACSIILKTDEKYPQTHEIQFSNTSLSELDKVHVGDVIKVAFNLRGNTWKSPSGEIKYFTKIQGWKVSIPDAPAGKRMGNIEESFQEEAINHLNNEMEDDLPF
jgi:hypothetical protein